MKKRIFSVFTLLELLVVVAIIGILVSLLLPALKNARETSYKIKCAGLLKNFGMAFAMYGNDYSVYPNHWTPYWLNQILPYINKKYESKMGLDTYLHSIDFSCPKKPSPGTEWPAAGSSDVFSYGYNVALCTRSLGAPMYRKVDSIPGNIAVLIDSCGRTIYDSTRMDPTSNGARYRHLGGANILFAGGHTAWYKMQDAMNKYNQLFYYP